MPMKYPFLSLALCFLTGCSAPIQQALLPAMVPASDTLFRVYVDGQEIIISEKEQTTVAVGAVRIGDEIELTVATRNHSDGRIDLLPRNIKVFKTVEGKRSKALVFTAEQYLRMMETRHEGVAFLEAFVTGLASAYSGYARQAVDATFNVDGETTSVSGSVVTYDSERQRQRTEELSQRNRESKAERDWLEATTYQSLLKANTIFPEQQVVGLVKVHYRNIPQGIRQAIEITIPVGEDVHVMHFGNDTSVLGGALETAEHFIEISGTRDTLEVIKPEIFNDTIALSGSQRCEQKKCTLVVRFGNSVSSEKANQFLQTIIDKAVSDGLVEGDDYLKISSKY